MLREALTAALRLLAVLSILTGLLYPLAMTGLAGLLFPGRAGGSLVTRDGRTVGSELVAQPFDDARHFRGRPSAARLAGDAIIVSGGSNEGPDHPGLRDSLRARVDSLMAEAGPGAGPPPVDLVTASASGLDPHISPAAALWQAPRVAAARGLDPAEVAALIGHLTEPRTFGLLGEPRVNVLRLNLALDALR